MSDSQQQDSNRPNPYAAPDEALGDDRGSRISLPLLLGLIAIIIALFFLNVGLGVGAVLLAIPAYARAARRSAVRLSAGQTVTSLDRFLSFLASLTVVIGCVIAGCIAFFVTCTVSIPAANTGEYAVWGVIIVSLLGFLFAAGLLYRVAWPAKITPKEPANSPHAPQNPSSTSTTDSDPNTHEDGAT